MCTAGRTLSRPCSRLMIKCPQFGGGARLGETPAVTVSEDDGGIFHLGPSLGNTTLSHPDDPPSLAQLTLSARIAPCSPACVSVLAR